MRAPGRARYTPATAERRRRGDEGPPRSRTEGWRNALCAAFYVPPKFGSPQAYTPTHLAEKILTSRSALEGERKQVTVLFADLKGSMELLADRDPEEARKLLDPVLERMMEAIHRYEGTVNQVMGGCGTGFHGPHSPGQLRHQRRAHR